MLKSWIEAMRLRTLPVSISGVLLAIGYGYYYGNYNYVVILLCLMFAILAQIASNFANEYYDFKDGLDRKGREGPRRGVTEGDITPQAMKLATYITLALACCIGCSLIYFGGWWLVLAGVMIAIGVIAYSAGPYPLSRHCLGEVAVVFFFGIIPVNLTYYVQTLSWEWYVLWGSISAGLMGANVLIINNYRDRDDDRAVGKNTIAVKLGRYRTSWIYLLNGYIAVLLMLNVWMSLSIWSVLIPVIYLVLHTVLWRKMQSKYGAQLNPMLGMTAMLMLFYSLSFMIVAKIANFAM